MSDQASTSIPSKAVQLSFPVTPELAAIIVDAELRLRTRRYKTDDVLGFEHLLVCAGELSRLGRAELDAVADRLKEYAPDCRWPAPDRE
ncbi:hypothetical protein [Tsukamurella tyrosinosolvens]|uniref:hypothetical protein n=1 Tax=Tsukamurella tyrosinosolvens TaxID=57704 RepID=UPI002DD444C3|nr:hypothetical protein [Tsukamurella tyrosinosolvens]MEC4614611.1 hypothetical protein [Tsukamurella tyrosinosolvens]